IPHPPRLEPDMRLSPHPAQHLEILFRLFPITWLLMQNPEILRAIGTPGRCELGPRSLVVQDRFLPGDPPATETTAAVIPQVDGFSEVCLSGPLLPQPHPGQGRNLIPGYDWGGESIGVTQSADGIPLRLK